MATKYFALLTNIGAAKLANATALGAQLEINQMAVGDGNGALPTPNPAQSELVHEMRRAQLNMLTVDPVNTNQIIAEQVIPEDVGGWWIREIGLFDKDGDMIAVANCAETYKPQLQEGSGRVQVIRVILIVSSTEAITLKIDPSVVLATREYVDEKIIEVKDHAEDVMKLHIKDDNPHKQYMLAEKALEEIKEPKLAEKSRENLGLGSAAVADVQAAPDNVSSLDALLKVGSFGLGVPIVVENIAPHATFAKWADNAETGIYYFPDNGLDLFANFFLFVRNPFYDRAWFMLGTRFSNTRLTYAISYEGKILSGGIGPI